MIHPINTRAIRAGLALALALAITAVSAAERDSSGRLWYRYTDAEGRVVLDDQVPPEAAPRGYEILNGQGQVIDEVPPQATEEDLAARKEARRAELRERRLAAWDASLLRRYSSREDIEAARDRAINEIRVRITILRSNLHSTRSQVEKEQAKAADLERRGVDVPEELTEAISVLKDEAAGIEASIEARRNEIEDVRADYQKDIERFALLQPKVEMRRKSYRESREEEDEFDYY